MSDPIYGYKAGDNPELDNIVKSHLESYDRAASMAALPTITPTIPGVVNDPSRTQTTHQSGPTNWWHTMFQSIDQTQIGALHGELGMIDDKLAALDRGESTGDDRGSLQVKRTELLQDINDNIKELASNPVDLDWQTKVQANMANPDVHPIEDLKYGFPQGAGSSASMLGAQALQMAAPMIGSAVNGFLEGGPWGAAAGMVAGAGIGAYAMWKARSQESFAEVDDARQQKLSQLIDDYTTQHGVAPSQQVIAKFNEQASVGLQELYDKNMKLMMGDMFDTALMTIPLVNDLGATMKATRAGRNLLRASTFALESAHQGMEEGQQYMWQQDYANGQFTDTKGFLGNTADYFKSIPTIAGAMAGTSRPDLYTDPQFRSSVKSGWELGVFMGGLPVAIGAVKDHITYNSTLAALSPEAQIQVDDNYSRFKAETLHNLFSKDRESFVYNAINKLGTAGMSNFTPEDAQTEITAVRDLKKEWDDIQNPTKGLLGKFWNTLDTQARGKAERRELDRQKLDAFTSLVSIKNHERGLAPLEDNLANREVIDSEGFVTGLYSDIEGEIDKNADKLGLADDIRKQIPNDRLDVLVQAKKAVIEKHKQNIQDILSGKKLVEYRDSVAQLKDAQAEVAKGNLVPIKRLTYLANEKAAIERYKFLDTIRPSIIDADNATIRKNLQDHPVSDVIDSIQSAPSDPNYKGVKGIPITKDTYEAVEQAAKQELSTYGTIKAQHDALQPYDEEGNHNPEAEAEQLKLAGELNRLDTLKSKVEDLKSNIIDNKQAPKTDNEYRRLHADNQLSDTDRISSLLSSQENVPLDRAEKHLESLQDLKSVFDSTDDLKKLDEFKGFGDTLNEHIEAMKSAVKEIERRLGDRRAKDDRIAVGAIRGLWKAAGINLVVDSDKGEIVAQKSSNSFIGALIDKVIPGRLGDIITKAINEYRTTKQLRTVYPEAIIRSLVQASTTDQLNEAINSEKNAITDTLIALANNGTFSHYDKLWFKGFINSPDKVMDTLIVHHKAITTVMGSGQKILNDFRLHRSADLLRSEMSAANIDINNLIDIYERAVAIHKLEIAANSDYNLGDELELELAKIVGDKNLVAPSKQQVNTIRESLRWLKSVFKGKLDTPYRSVGYIAGPAGAGKTTIAGHIRRLLNLSDDQIYVATPTVRAFDVAATSLGINKADSKYASNTDTVTQLISLLVSKADSLSKLKVIFLDEAGFLTFKQWSDLTQSLETYNESRTPAERVKILALGDPYQIKSEPGYVILEINSPYKDNLGEMGIEVLPPLGTVYRTDLPDITATANLYKGNSDTITELPTRVDNQHLFGILASKATEGIFDELSAKAKNGLLWDGRKRLIVVDNEQIANQFTQRIAAICAQIGKAVPAELEVLPYSEAPGLTVAEVYVAITKQGLLEKNREYNNAMYALIGRAKYFAYVVDKNLTKINQPQISSTMGEVSDTAQKEFAKNRENYDKSVNEDLTAYKDLGFATKPAPTTSIVGGQVETVEQEPLEEQPTEKDLTDEELSTKLTPEPTLITVDVAKGELDLQFPQAYPTEGIPAWEKGVTNTNFKPVITAGDNVMFVKAEHNGEKHIRVVQKISDFDYRLVGIIGSKENGDSVVEMDYIRQHFPQIYHTLQSALADNSIDAIRFTAAPNERWKIVKDAVSKVKAIVTAKVKNYSPFDVKFDGTSKDITEDLKRQVIEDVRNTFLKQGQLVHDIKVTGVIYTNKSRNELVTDNPHQNWVSPGRPYLRVDVSLKNKDVTFNIPCGPKRLDTTRDAKFLEPLIQFHKAITELENTYTRVLGNDAPRYNSNEPSSITKGQSTVITKGELFERLAGWYAGSRYLGEKRKANFSQETELDERLRAGMSTEEFKQMEDLRQLAREQAGITKRTKPYDETKLTDADETPEEMEPPLTRSTDVKQIGTSDEGLPVFTGSKGDRAVWYYKYKGLYIKFKSSVEKLGNSYRLTGELTANVQRDLNTATEGYMAKRNINLRKAYSSEDFSEGNLENTLDSVIDEASVVHTGTYEDGTGAAQKRLDAIQLINPQFTDSKGRTNLLRRELTTIVDGVKKPIKIARSLFGETIGDEQVSNRMDSDALTSLLYDKGAIVFRPLHLTGEELNKNGDNFDTSLAYTRYSGLQRTQAVLDSLAVPGETTAPVEERAPAEGTAAKSVVEAPKKSRRGLRTRDTDEELGKALTKGRSAGTKDISKQKAIDLIRSLIPNVTDEQVRLVSELEMMRVTQGNAAWGYLKGGIIYLLSEDGKTVKEQVARHEAFHYVFNILTNPLERLSIFDAAGKASGLSNRLELEEWLAEKFQVYRSTNKTRFGWLRDLFKRITSALGFIDKNTALIEKYFESVEAGKTEYYNPKAVDIRRSMVKVNERFGSIDNYLNSERLLLQFIRSKMYDYKDRTGNIAPIGEDESGYVGLPVSFQEAKQQFIDRALTTINKVDLGQELTATELRELPYFRILLKDEKVLGIDNIDAVLNNYYKRDLQSPEYVEDLEESLEGTDEAEIADADLRQEIIESGYTDYETKTTEAIRDWLRSISIIQNEQIETLNPRFSHLKLLEACADIVTNDEDMQRELEYQFQRIGLDNENMRKIYDALNELRTLSDSTRYRDLDGNTRDLPLGSFDINRRRSNSDSFTTSDGTIIKRGNRTTDEFFNDIIKKSGIEDIDALNVMYRRDRARTTFNEVLSFFSSQRARDPYGISVETTTEEIAPGMGKSITKTYKPFRQSADDIVTAVRGDIKQGLRDSVGTKKFSSFITRFKNAKLSTNEERISVITDFFYTLGFTKLSDLLTLPQEVNEAIADIRGLIQQVESDKDIETALNNSEGRLTFLSHMIGELNIHTAASNFTDLKNRRKYRFILHSWATNVINRLTKRATSNAARRAYEVEDFINDNPVTDRFRNNILLNGLNTIFFDQEATKDFDSTKETEVARAQAIEYRKESDEDIVNRRFHGNFVGWLSNHKERSYIQQMLTISDKPNPISHVVGILNVRDTKRAIENAIEFELSRGAHIDALKARGIENKTFSNNRNKFYFVLNRELTDSEKNSANRAELVDLIYNTLLQKASVSFSEIASKTVPNNEGITAKVYNSLSATNMIHDRAEVDKNKALYTAYSLNNTINSYFMSLLYNSDPAFGKAWHDTIKRLQTMAAMGQSPSVSKYGMMREMRIAISEDKPLFINELTDYSGVLNRLYKDRGESYDSTDAQMYYLPEFTKELKKGYGTSQGIGSILKPVIAGIDKYGVPRAIKVSGVELSDTICAISPELAKIREQMRNTKDSLGNPTHMLVYNSGMKLGNPKEIYRQGTALSENNIITLPSDFLRIQLNPIAEVDNSIVQFSQLLYLLNVNRLNFDKTQQIYDASSQLMGMEFNQFMKENILNSKGDISPNKVRGFILRTLLDKKVAGSVTSGSARIYELLDHSLTAEEKTALLDTKTKGGPTLDLNMPSIIKKVITQLISALTSQVINTRYEGSKLILTSGANFKMFYNEQGHPVTYNLLSKEQQRKVDSFYNRQDWSYQLKNWLIRAQEAIDTGIEGSMDKLHKGLTEYTFTGDRPASDDFRHFGITEEERAVIDAYIASGDKELDGTKIPRRLRIIRDQKTGDNYAEVIMPRYKALDIAKKLGIPLDELRTTLLGVRIPTSGINSSLPIKVVGWFGEEEHNLLAAPEELSFLHGSDFDVDSMFTIRRELASGEDTTNDSRDGRRVLASGDTILTSEGDVVGYNQDGSFNDEFDKKIFAAVEATKKELGTDKGEFFTKASSLLKKYLKNKQLNHMLNIILDDKNRKDMLAPISQEVFEEHIFPMLRQILGEEDLLKAKDLFDFKDQIYAQGVNMGAKGWVGAVANTMKTMAYLLFSAQMKGQEATIRYDKDEPVAINGSAITKIEDTELQASGDQKYKVWDLFNSLLNSAIDNAKEQRLAILGISEITGRFATMGTVFGIPMKDVVLILKQPEIAQIVNVFNRFKRDSTLAASVDTLEKRLQTIVGGKEFIETGWRTHLTSDSLVSRLRSDADNTTDEAIKTAYAALKVYKFFDNIGEQMFNTGQGLSLLRKWDATYDGLNDSIKALELPNSEDFPLEGTNLIAKQEETTSIPGVSHIQQVYDIAKSILGVLQNLVYVQHPKVDEFIGKIEDLIKFSSKGGSMRADERPAYIRAELMKYLLSSFPAFADDPNEIYKYTETEGNRDQERLFVGNQAWLQKFVRTVYEVKQAHADNLFLQHMTTASVGGNKSLIRLEFTGGTALTDSDKLLMAHDLAKLPIEIQKGFLKYAVLTQGLEFGVRSYSNYISPEVQLELSEYLGSKIKDTLANTNGEYHNNIITNFALQLALKSIDDIPYLSDFAEKQDIDGKRNMQTNTDKAGSGWDIRVIADKETLPFVGKVGKDSPTLFVLIRTEESADGKHVGFYQRLGKDPNSTASSALYANMYTASRDILDNGYDVASKFNMDTRVEIADPTRGAAPTDGKNRLSRNTAGQFATKYFYKEGDIVSLINAYDITRNSIYDYRVAKVTREETKITYDLVSVERAEPRAVDKSLIATSTEATITPAMLERIRTSNVKKTAELVLRRAELTPIERKLLEHMTATIDPKMQLKVVTNAEMNVLTEGKLEAGGLYKDRTIYLNQETFSGTGILIHEMAHAVTSDKLDLYETARHKLSTRDQVACRNLKNLFFLANKAYKEQGLKQFDYAFKNVHEFVAEAFRDKDFQIWLGTLELNDDRADYLSSSTIFSKILDAILSLLGIKSNTVLAKTFENAFTLTETQEETSSSTGHALQANTAFEQKLTENTADWRVSDDQKSYENISTGKRADRVNDFIHTYFKPFKAKRSGAEIAADAAFKGRNKTTDKVMFTRTAGKPVEVTYDEYVRLSQRNIEYARVKGKIIHKIIEFYLTHNTALRNEIDQLAAANNEHDAIKFRFEEEWLQQHWRTIMRKAGLTFDKDAGLIGKDVTLSEVVLVNEELGLAGTADMLIKHQDGTYSIADFKTGKYIVENRNLDHKLIEHARELGIEWNNMAAAKLQLMTYALLAKSTDRSIKFRDLQVLHIDRNSAGQINYSVEMADYLKILESYFKSTKTEWYNANKDLFNIKNYGGTLLHIDDDYKSSGLGASQYVYETGSKIRSLNIEIEKLGKEERIEVSGSSEWDLIRSKKSKLEVQRDELTKKLAQFAYKDDRLFDGLNDKRHDMSIVQEWLGNRYIVRNKFVQAIFGLITRFEQDKHEYLIAARKLREDKFKPVLDEYYRRSGKGILNKVTFGQLDTMNYRDLFEFMWDITPEGRRMRTERGDMTDAQWEYNQFIRKQLRYEFYLTMNPTDKAFRKLLADDTATLVGSDKDYAQKVLELAKSAPKINKLEESSAFAGRGFVLPENFAPMIPARTGERLEMGINADFFKSIIRQQAARFTSKDAQMGELKYGVPVLYMDDNGRPESEFSYNTELAMDYFTANLVNKRFTDTGYSLGMAAANVLKSQKDMEGKSSMERTARFVENQMMLEMNLHKSTAWSKKGFYIAGKKIDFDSLIRVLRSYGLSSILGFNWRSGIVYGLMQNLFTIKDALANSATNLFKLNNLDLDFGVGNLAKAYGIWFKFQSDRVGGQERNSKVYNMLRVLDYQADDTLYPVNKARLLGVKNKAFEGSLLYSAYSTFAQQTDGVVMIAQLLHSGMWDKYDNSGNYIGGERGVDSSGRIIAGLTSEEINRLKHISERMQGSYRKNERTAAELYSLGQLLLSIKRWIPTMLFTSWSSRYDSHALGRWIDTGKTTDVDGKELKVFSWESRVNEGRARVFLKYLGATLIFNKMFFTEGRAGRTTNYNWEKLTPEQKASVMNCYVQIAMWAGLVVAIDGMFAGTPDDDKWKRRMGRVPGYIMQGWNVNELLRAGAEPTQVLPQMSKTADAMYDYLIQSGVQGERVKTGANKGRWKGASTVERSVPGLRQFENFFETTGRPIH